jgi:hypothetical protein
MSILPDALRAYEQELLQKAEMLALGLNGLRATAPARAAELLEAITEKLAAAAIQGGSGTRTAASGGDVRGQTETRRLNVVSARGSGADDIEDFIMDILAENPTGLSVQDIVNDLEEAQLDIRRQTLVVRLHRMVRAGKISPLAHGHYVLSEAERGRRRA